MEFFKEGVEVRLKSHLDKYLVADDDQVTVRQSDSAAGTCRARWLIEHVDSNSHVIRLKSCYGGYLTASNKPFLGLLGKKLVLQTLEGNILANEWQPVKDGFQVKLKAFDGTYLRANGAMPPWRNTVTHDMTNSNYNNDNWILFDVETVDDQEDSIIKSMVTGFSLVSDEISPVSIIHYSSPFSPLTPILSIIQKRRRRSCWFEERESGKGGSVSVMEVFENAKAVRLKNSHNKYLHADDDQESVSQDRNGSSKNNRWTVEFLNDNQIIRLKSCYNKYLTASNQPFLLGMTGRKVLQTLPTILDSSVEWEPIREGNQVKLRTRYGQYLRANGGVPPWRNSVTHDVPAHRTATQQSVLWDVDVVDIVILNSPVPTPPPPLLTRHSSSSFNSSSSSSSSFTTNTSLSQQQQDSPGERVKLEEGRTIYYHVVSYEFGENAAAITFEGNNLNDLTRKLEEETGLNNITICTRSPLNGNLYPLRLQLPPNNVTLKVVVVPNSPPPSSSSYQDTRMIFKPN